MANGEGGIAAVRVRWCSELPKYLFLKVFVKIYPIGDAGIYLSQPGETDTRNIMLLDDRQPLPTSFKEGAASVDWMGRAFVHTGEGGGVYFAYGMSE